MTARQMLDYCATVSSRESGSRVTATRVVQTTIPPVSRGRREIMDMVAGYVLMTAFLVVVMAIILSLVYASFASMPH